MAWQMMKTAAGHLSLDNFSLESDKIPELLRQLQGYFQNRFAVGDRFGLEAMSALAVEIRIDGAPLTVGWDNWSGVFIMAWDTGGDTAVRELEGYFCDD